MDEGEKGPMSTVQHRGETVIPAEVRKAMSLEDGSMLLWRVESATRAVVVRVLVKVELQ